MTFNLTMGKQHKINTNIGSFDSLPEKIMFCERLELASGSLNLLCGRGNAGKTFLAQYVASCASTGHKLFDQFDITQTAVLHVDQEQSEAQTLTRYIRIGAGLKENELNINHTKWERLPAKLLSKDINEIQQQLSSFLPEGGLVIIDSLRKLTSADENNGDMETLLDILKMVAEKTNTCIILLHHKGKYEGSSTEQTGRGHSSIYDSVDTQIDLTRLEDGKFELKCQKIRDGVRFENLCYSFHDEGVYVARRKCQSEIVFQVESIKSTDRALQVFNYIVSNQFCGTNDIHKVVKGDKAGLIKLLDEMFQLDHLDHKKKGNSNQWSTTPKGCHYYEELEKNNE
jgi:RecA-family ATPase